MAEALPASAFHSYIKNHFPLLHLASPSDSSLADLFPKKLVNYTAMKKRFGGRTVHEETCPAWAIEGFVLDAVVSLRPRGVFDDENMTGDEMFSSDEIARVIAYSSQLGVGKS